MKYIVVTGGAGYIGSHTIAEIVTHTPYAVISIDNYSNAYKEVYQKLQQLTPKTIIPIEVDLCQKESLFQALEPYQKDIHGILHFAAYKSVPESEEQPFKYYHNNLLSLLHITEFACRNNIQNIIFSSSCSVYGDIKTSPVTETTPLPSPSSVYAHTKQIGESILHQLTHSAQWPLKIYALRYFNPIGAHPSGYIGEFPRYNLTGLVPNIIRAALRKIPALEVYGQNYNTKDGTAIRDYVHVSDIARAHVLAMQYLDKITDPVFYDVLNLGTGKGNTVLEVIQTFEKVNHVKVPYKIVDRRKGDVEAIFANHDKAQKILNWKLEYTLEDMLRTAWQWGKDKY